jgi:hypothetical protein
VQTATKFMLTNITLMVTKVRVFWGMICDTCLLFIQLGK